MISQEIGDVLHCLYYCSVSRLGATKKRQGKLVFEGLWGLLEDRKNVFPLSLASKWYREWRLYPLIDVPQGGFLSKCKEGWKTKENSKEVLKPPPAVICGITIETESSHVVVWSRCSDGGEPSGDLDRRETSRPFCRLLWPTGLQEFTWPPIGPPAWSRASQNRQRQDGNWHRKYTPSHTPRRGGRRSNEGGLCILSTCST